MNHTRIYVFLGTPAALVDMMGSMETIQLFNKGEYMVIFVDMMTYNPKEALKYLWKVDQITQYKSCQDVDSNFVRRAQGLLVVVSTPPQQNYEKFSKKVREYNAKLPFNFTTPSIFVGLDFQKYISIYAAYLYDSVKLYAWALDKLLRLEERPLTDDVIREIASNGTSIIETIIKNRTYESVTGSTIKIDKYGDSEGNFSVLALKPEHPNFANRDNFTCTMHMIPVANFHQRGGENDLPVSEFGIYLKYPSETTSVLFIKAPKTHFSFFSFFFTGIQISQFKTY